MKDLTPNFANQGWWQISVLDFVSRQAQSQFPNLLIFQVTESGYESQIQSQGINNIFLRVLFCCTFEKCTWGFRIFFDDSAKSCGIQFSG